MVSRTRACGAAVLSLGALLLSATAQSQVLGVVIAGGFNSDSAVTGTYGYSFTSANAFTVTGLGLWVASQIMPFDPSLTFSHDVGIFDGGGVLVASATVDPGAATDSGFRFVDLGAPVALNAGTYTIGGHYQMGSIDRLQNMPLPITPGPGITIGTFLVTAGATLANPTTGTLPDVKFGPNFKYIALNAVPEPGVTALLAGLGVVGAGFAVRRARRK